MIRDEDKFTDLVDDLCSLPHETEWVEFKVNQFDPEEMGEYISALANSACLSDRRAAYFVFGIEDGTHKIVGTNVNFATEKVGNQSLSMWLNQLIDSGSEFELLSGVAHGKKIQLVRIGAATSYPTSFKGQEFIRVDSHKQPLRKNKNKARDLWAKLASEDFESRWAVESLIPSDALELIDYVSAFKLLQIPSPESEDAIIEKLCEEGVFERVEGRICISNLGAILFASRLSSFPTLARKKVRVISYQGVNKTAPATERVGEHGYAIGFEGLVRYIYDLIPVVEDMTGAIRRDSKPYSLVQIRELTANCLIHQDLTIKGTSPMIEIFTDRIEFTNPGQPLIDPRRFLDHSPRSRNEKIASLVRRIGVAEERGTGIDKVVKESEGLRSPALRVESTQDSTRVTLFSPKPWNQLDKNERVNAAYEHASYRHVSNDYLTNESLRVRLNIPDESNYVASRIITDANEAGLLKPAKTDNTSRRYAKYLPFYA
jgi:ATP-dependent DNA helicase RecG